MDEINNKDNKKLSTGVYLFICWDIVLTIYLVVIILMWYSYVTSTGIPSNRIDNANSPSILLSIITLGMCMFRVFHLIKEKSKYSITAIKRSLIIQTIIYILLLGILGLSEKPDSSIEDFYETLLIAFFSIITVSTGWIIFFNKNKKVKEIYS